MPTLDQVRIAEDRARPRVMELWWALRPLTSVIRFMNSGAHPDDETSAMLAALRFRDGFSLSFACSTRGEGGQNDIGAETSEDLGALRTAEMEAACGVLGMRMYWLSETPDDTIVDFGFSKSGTETLSKWTRGRTLSRFVEIVRTERPDIICPTFLDVPGQHGHHRAMTEAAHLVMAAAADLGFPSNLPTWQPKKLYLPAWSGAGKSYDDDLPPPPATLAVCGTGGDPVSGWSWDRIGQQSRTFHRTQGMGRWIPAGEVGQWPLHLVESHVAGPDKELASGLPVSVADLANLGGAEAIADDLRLANAAIEAAVAAFPDFASVAGTGMRALGHIRATRDACPPAVLDEVLHRLDEKELQLCNAIRIALGVEARGRLGDPWLHPGESSDVSLEIHHGAAQSADVAVDPPAGCSVEAGAFWIGQEVVSTNSYRPEFDPAVPQSPALVVQIEAHETRLACRLPLENPPVILPAYSSSLEPESAILNRAGTHRTIEIALSDLHPAVAEPELNIPDGWNARRTERGFFVKAPDTVAEGLYTVPLHLDGKAAVSVRRISYPHIAATARSRPAEVRIRVLSAELPNVRVGYVGGGNDRVAHWLGALGANVSALSDAELASDSELGAFDAVVIGIFAMRFRPGLREAMPRLHRWTEAGGTLVTLYHRPWDNWDPDFAPPRRIEIGQPSLRWRVTDAAAQVNCLAPSHPILTYPNLIGSDDWIAWHKERGLYFAKSWADDYCPLLEMADPDEMPLRGALLAANIGRGRHVHTALILHHQMEQLVPGAFRLMANLIARRE